MSTNNYPDELPDLAALERLANQFFSALPGKAATDHTNSPLTQQASNPALFAQQDNFGFENLPVDLPGAGTNGFGNIPSSVAGSGISPSALNVFSGVDLLGAQFVVPPPPAVGFGKVPPSLGGVGVSPSVSTYENAIDLRKQQPAFTGLDNLVLGQMPQSVAGSGASPSAINNADPVDKKIPHTELSDSNSVGFGNVPQSVAGSGKSPSVIEHGNAVDISNPQTSLPDPNTTGLGNVPESVAGSGISPSAIYQGNGVDLKNPQTSFSDPHTPAPALNRNTNSGSSEYTSYLKNINSHTGLDGKTPLLIESNRALPASLQHLPYQSEQPFETELHELLKNIPTAFSGQQLPYTPPSGLGFYFLNEKEHFRTALDASGVLQTELKDNNGHGFDVNRIKLDFPILQERVNGKPLIWLDNAATTQKPRQVIDRISYFYDHENSNIHRAAHELAARATDAYEEARKKVQVFLNAGSVNEIVFVRGATEAINLVAKSWGEQYLNAGDEIILSQLEHHANIVPWQQLAAKKGLNIKVIPVDDDGQILLGEYSKLLGPKTKLVSFSQVSNALGTVTPAQQIVDMAHQAGAKVLVDGAQSVSHMRVDVRALDADWFVFSGHKVFGPTGIGVLYGKEDILNQTQPWQGGGNMIKDVTFEYTQYHNAPLRFEAGTGNIADAVGLGAALDYVSKIGIDLISQYEHYLLVYANGLLKDVPGLRLIGTATDKASVLSFVLDGFSTEQVGSALNQEGIAVRSGHHCAQPILRRFGLETTVRPSLAFYNTCADIDTLALTLHRLKGSRRY
ncbi:MAG: family 2A encapsulin nanocompartment cargo protein cysteine desulfurase [Mucilaginibacter sp.]